MSTPDLYDTIIVGAGPGGATAGYFLAEAGQRVLILERDTPPRYKACGGGLSAHVLEDIFPFSFAPVIETRVQTITWALGQRSAEFPVPAQAVRTVMRAQFDAYLLAHTRAEVRPPVSAAPAAAHCPRSARARRSRRA